MTAQDLRTGRRQLGWTQKEAAARLGVSQPYLALLEKGKRNPTPKFAQRAARLLNLPPTVLPLREELPKRLPPGKLAQRLAALGYSGFAYMRSAWRRNPAEVLMTALAQDNLEARLTEALPWLMLNCADMHHVWLVRQAKVQNLTNRLGYVTNLAKRLADRTGDDAKHKALAKLEEELKRSRLAAEDTFCQGSLSANERQWLAQTRPPEAAEWHVLTDLSLEHLPYA